MAATTRKTAAAKAAPAIDPEAFYTVTVAERFEHRRIPFGTISVNEVRGSILADVLAGEHASKVSAFEIKGA